MADFSQNKKYNYNWQSSKFKNLALSGSYISQFINDAGYVTSSVAISASYALTASYLTGTIASASYALTASYVNPLNQNVVITGSIYIPNNNHSIYFSGSGAASRLTWNDTEGTLNLGLKGGSVTLQIGQENVVRVVNKTGTNLLEADFKVVRVRSVAEGGAQGQRLAIVLAQANNDTSSSTTLGIVTENISNNQEGFITVFGNVNEIDTTGAKSYGGLETWVDGDTLYLSPYYPGYLTNVKPTAPNHIVIVGYVVYAHAVNGKIFIKVDNGYELGELHDVQDTTTTSSYGDLLVKSGSVWINSKQLTGSYGLTGSLNATSFTGSLLGTSSYAIQALSASYAPSNVTSTILYNSTTPVLVTGTTSETLIASVPIPSNITNTTLRSSFIVVVTTLGGAAPRTRMRIGTIANPTSVQLSSQTQLGTNAVGSANAVSMYRTMPVVGGVSGNIKVIANSSNINADYGAITTYNTISVDWTTQQYIYFTIINNTISAVTECYGVLLEQLKQ